MSVSARTFQILYILRQRAKEGLETKGVSDFADYIAVRRMTKPDKYTQAYISPSAIYDLVERMGPPPGYNMLSRYSMKYSLTALGSQMMDLLEGVDCCSDDFIQNYKEIVVKAVLLQRQRLNQTPATQTEIAGLANISTNSVKRGLATLIEAGEVEVLGYDRSPLYQIVSNPQPTTQSPVEDNELKALLKTIEEEDSQTWTKPEPEPDPTPEPEPDPTPEPEPEVHPDFKWEFPMEIEIHPARPKPEDAMPLHLQAWASVPVELMERHRLLAEILGVSLHVYMQGVLKQVQRQVRADLFS